MKIRLFQFIARANRAGSLTTCMCGKRKHNPSFTAVNSHVCQRAYGRQVLEDTKSKVLSQFCNDLEVISQSRALVTIDHELK